MRTASYNLRLTNGNDTVQLASVSPLGPGESFILTTAYVPTESAGPAAATGPDGVAAAASEPAADEAVTETCSLYLGGALEEARRLLNRINRLLQQAERRVQTGRARPVYVELDVAGDGDYWRSELLGGHAGLDPHSLSGYWRERGRLAVTLRWKRRPWWEGALREVGLWHGDRFVTGGVTIWNHEDGEHTNWVALDSGALAGDRPAPLRLMIRPYDAGHAFRRVFVAGDLGDDYGATVEGESGPDGARLPAASSTHYSGLYYAALSWAGAAEQRIGRWTLEAARLAAAGGRWVRAILRATNVPAGLRGRLRLYAGGFLAWSGPQVSLEVGHELHDLGVLQLPPPMATASAAMELQLWAAGGDEAGSTLNVDYFQFLPLDNWRRYRPTEDAAQAAAGQWLVDDGTEGRVYVLDGEVEMPCYAAYGGPLVAIPPAGAASQRLYVLAEDEARQAVAWRSMTVKVYYRPRRGSL